MQNPSVDSIRLHEFQPPIADGISDKNLKVYKKITENTSWRTNVFKTSGSQQLEGANPKSRVQKDYLFQKLPKLQSFGN